MIYGITTNPFHIIHLKQIKKNRGGVNSDKNLLIEGDNLLALKSLLPNYHNKIKCIYIDPPYNTGNTEKDEWIYNDNANNPRIKNWLGKSIKKDDLTRHDAWLCMMTPRLQLLKELLADDGAIFISIDDNEYAHLKLLCDEIFGIESHIGTLIHQRASGGGQAKKVVKGHDYILVYSKKQISLVRPKIVRQEVRTINGNKYIINDDWLRRVFGKYDKTEDRRCFYEEIVDIKGQEKKDEIDSLIKEGKVVLKRNKEGKHIVCQLIPLDESSSKLYSIIKTFPRDNKEDLNSIVKVFSEEGKKDLVKLGIGELFPYPKPVDLVKILINSITLKSNTEDIILDSFAGSGTTAQSVMELNKQDGGQRRFILIQLNEPISEKHPAFNEPYNYRYIHEITKSRIDKAVKKFKYRDGYTYQTLGHPIDPKNILSSENLPPYKDLAEYVFYLRTGTPHPSPENINASTYKVGVYNNISIYLSII